MNTLVLLALLSTNVVSLKWNSLDGAHYRVQGATSLRAPIAWTVVTNVLGTGQPMELKVAPTARERYFQVVLRTSPFTHKTLYLETNTPAQQWAVRLKDSAPQDSAALLKIASQPTTAWINSSTDVSKIGQVFLKCGTNLPVFSLYNIYERDYSGGFSAGGAQTPLLYTNFINACAVALAAKECVVVIEPDALSNLDALPATDQQTRLELLSYAVDRLSKVPTVHAYICSGHPHWKDAPTMIARLKQVHVEKIQGFALNISNFIRTSECISYGKTISDGLDGMHFIIDTSRNGQGPTADYQWCNPPDRGLGFNPRTATGNPLVDAYLWIKYPGESDGQCNGGMAAGTFWVNYAVMLANNQLEQ